MKQTCTISVVAALFMVSCVSARTGSTGLVCRVESEQTTVVRGHPYTFRAEFQNQSTNTFTLLFDWKHRAPVSLDFLAIPNDGEPVVLDQKHLRALEYLRQSHLQPTNAVSGRYTLSTYQLPPGDYEFCLRYVCRTNSVEWFMGIGEHFHPGGTIDDVWMGELESNRLKLKITDKIEERPTKPSTATE